MINPGKQSVKPKPPPKDWESVNMIEKALELYMGEKRLLFWLNKFAYATIFIIIRGWILFRSVGPALDLYQLDTHALLSPESMFKGSEEKP
ncbi:putative endoglucanase 2-like [Capsicum annuum]|nr:putative endoglucanase 2-like [Capsicum annuum]KAF3684642.1 putative endoglucanase 2-like [Capsicum annuum]